MIRKIINVLSEKILIENREFKNKHKGEECYLIGNGSSIKFFDLSDFTDKISIGCNALNIHNDIKKLDIRYYVNVHPMYFCKYWREMKSGFYLEKNVFHDFEKSLPQYNYKNFVHITNYPCIKNKENYRFVHNFDRHELSTETLDFSKSSSLNISDSKGEVNNPCLYP